MPQLIPSMHGPPNPEGSSDSAFHPNTPPHYSTGIGLQLRIPSQNSLDQQASTSVFDTPTHSRMPSEALMIRPSLTSHCHSSVSRFVQALIITPHPPSPLHPREVVSISVPLNERMVIMQPGADVPKILTVLPSSFCPRGIHGHG